MSALFGISRFILLTSFVYCIAGCGVETPASRKYNRGVDTGTLPASSVSNANSQVFKSPRVQSAENPASLPGHLRNGFRYVNDAKYRRDVLETSLVNHQNGYAQKRLASYTDDNWGDLKVLNPRFRPVRPEDLGKGTPKPNQSWQRIPLDDIGWNDHDLLTLGEAMFTGYPAQLAHSMSHVISNVDNPKKYGLWQTEKSVGGLIWVELPGGVFPAMTCATCHANIDAQGKLSYGLPNHRIDIGKAQDGYSRRMTTRSMWGPGMADISSDGVDNPISIADLRAVRFQNHLHRTANIKNSPEALAVRLETGLIMVARRSVRPPRIATFALAHFVTQLGTSLTPIPNNDGHDVFNKHCASCHQGEALSGPPVPIDKVRSNRDIATSASRTTGFMQNTSLRGVSDRHNLLCNGKIHSFEGLLQSDRSEHGHYFGLNLPDNEKKKLIQFLQQL
ncbi:MAG: hypothetical protein JXX14_18350 [Deltaproteobacteria bacterium]|nr:hypothetical protein [Deltaproteobacteria bacterium]